MSSGHVMGTIRANGLILSMLLAAFCLVAVDCDLFWQNRDLKESLNNATAGLRPSIGSTVPPLTGVDLSASPVAVQYGGDARPTLLLVFQPDCDACAANWPLWDDLLSRLDRSRVRVVFANIGNPVSPAFAKAHRLENEIVVAKVDTSSLSVYNVIFSPETILISRVGKVADIWVGSLRRDVASDIRHEVNTLALGSATTASTR
jgi:hypothetical protein